MLVTLDDIVADRVDVQALRRQELQLQAPDNFNFAFDILDRRAEDLEKVAVVAVSGDRRSIARITYAAISRDSNRLASGLKARGFGAGDRAFVMMERVPEWFTVIFGCIKAGVSPAPATNLLSASEIQYRAEIAAMRIAFVTPGNLGRLRAAKAHLPLLELVVVVGDAYQEELSLEALLAEGHADVRREDLPSNAADDEMMLFFTSGTSAHPKEVSHDHRYSLAHFITGTFWMDLRPGDVHWTLTDTGWAKAAWGLLFPPMIRGATVVLYNGGTRFDPGEHLRLIEQLGVTCLCAPPTAYRQFAQLELGNYKLGSLRHSMAAGEPLNPEVIRTWYEASGTIPHDGYGQTETINIVGNQLGFPIKAGSMGRPMPGNIVDIIDDNGIIRADDMVGNIAVKIDGAEQGIFAGYGSGGTRDIAAFRNGWYYTGDLARRDADGYFWFVGRGDDVITSAGYRISPFEVESALLSHPAVAESAVIGVPDALRGHVVKAFIVLALGWEATEDLADVIKCHAKENHAFYSYPRQVEFVSALPKTVSGKIRRAELRGAIVAGRQPCAPTD